MRKQNEKHPLIPEDRFEPESDAELGFCISSNVGESIFNENSGTAHRHPFYEMVLLWDADGEHRIDHEVYTTLKNSVFLIRPGQVHCWRNVTHASGILIYFTEDFLYQSCVSVNAISEIQLFKELSLTSAIYPDESMVVELKALTDLMLREYEKKEEDYASALRAALNLLLIRFRRLRNCGNAEEANDLCLRFQQLLGEHVSDNLTSSDYANLLGVSRAGLNAHLNRRFGVSAGILIRQAQIEEIRRLLVNTDLMIAEIAAAMNFCDAGYLCRVFKAETGETPLSCRSRCVGTRKERLNA